MTRCNQALRQLAGDAHEPYREVLRGLRDRLRNTLLAIEGELQDQSLVRLRAVMGLSSGGEQPVCRRGP